MTKVKVVKRGVLNIKGDLLVAEIDRQMRPLLGAGLSVWKHSGITKEDLLNVGGEMNDGEIRVTYAKNLKDNYTAILHVAIPTFDSSEPSLRNKSLSMIYRSILEKTIAMENKTLVLPVLGIRSLGVSVEDGVNVAIVAINHFLSEKNNKGLHEIIIFTTQGNVHDLVKNHQLFQSPIMQGENVNNDSTDHRFVNCVVANLRESGAHGYIPNVQIPCNGNILSLSTMKIEFEADDSSTNPFFGADHEADLIMSRLGQFNVDWSGQESLNLEICETHRIRLSSDWHNSFYKNIKFRENNGVLKPICSFPEHICKKGTLIPFVRMRTDRVQKSESILWIKRRKTVIPPGLPACEACLTFLRSSEFNDEYASQETRELETLMEIDFNDDGMSSLTEKMEMVPRIPAKIPSTADKKVKDAVIALMQELKCEEALRKKNWIDMGPRQRRKKVSITRIAIDAVCEVIAPDAKAELKELATIGRRKQESDKILPFNKLVGEAADLYARTDSKIHRLFILASVASLELPLLQQFFHGLTPYMHQKARRVVCNPGQPINEPHVKVRYEQTKVDRLLGFVLSPLVVLNIPYDERTEKMDDGTVENLPNFMRLQTIEEVYLMYRAYLIEEGEEYLLLKETTAKSIIKLVAPTRRKNLTCVDEKIGDGMKAFDDLFEMISDLEKRQFILKDISLELTRSLQHCKSYLRGDFKAHIKTYSNCADHCAAFALSDPKEKKLSRDCSNAGTHSHSHDSECDRCELVKTTIEELREELQNAENTTANAAEREHFRSKCEELEVCKKAILEMKKHQMRAAVSHSERAEYVEELKEGTALVTLDWAQKMEPLHAREKQSDYYAKTGIGYHISHAVTVRNGAFAEHTSVHIVGPNVPQDGAAVSMITKSFLLELKQMGIQSCIIRSDNAGCYRNGPLIRSLIVMQSEIGVRIEGFMYSEAQAGKSACDRGSARVKRKARDSVASLRKKIDTKETFFEMITTGKLMNAVSIHLCTISGVENVTSKIPNITSYSSFTFEQAAVRLRRHRSIGEGILFDFTKLDPCIGTMEIHKSEGYTVNSGESFWITQSREEVKDVSTPSDSNSSGPSVSRMLPCPEENCIDEFISFRELEKHLLRGKHSMKLERKTLHDYCSKAIATSLDTHFSITSAKLRVAVQLSAQTGLTQLEKGWALRSIQKRNLNDEEARELVRTYFHRKRKANEKCNPHEAEMHMKTMKKPGSGGLLISPKNRLSISQIKSLINGLLKKEYDTKHNIVSKPINVEEEDEDGLETDDEADLNEMVVNSGLFKKDEEDTSSCKDVEKNAESDSEPRPKLRRKK